MAGRTLIAALLLAAAPCLADDTTVPSTLEHFGLLGTWAVDCAKPPGPENEYSTYSVPPSGKARLAFSSGAPYRDIVYEIQSAAPEAQGQLALQVMRLPEKIYVDLVLSKIGDTVQVWSSHTPDGRMLVTDGVITGNGLPSPRFKRCGK